MAKAKKAKKAKSKTQERRFAVQKPKVPTAKKLAKDLAALYEISRRALSDRDQAQLNASRLVGQLAEARSHGFGSQLAYNELLKKVIAEWPQFNLHEWEGQLKALLEARGHVVLGKEEMAALDPLANESEPKEAQ